MDKIGPGGIFFSLPQEIRDEIYRYLVKGHYLFCQSRVDWSSTFPKAVLRTSFGRPNLAIFQVSKATYNEATSIFYSESIFRYQLSQIYASITYPPGPAKNRMMQIHLDFELCLYGEWNTRYHNEIEHNLQATIDNFTGLGSPHTILHIKFNLNSETHRMLSLHFFQRLKAFVSFRTVIVGLGPASEFFASEYGGGGYKRLAQAIEEEMVHTMGPATLTLVDLHLHLEFHPLEHMRANLCAQEEEMQMEMDKLVPQADRLEEGN